jgi:fructosamine-3-kinase
LIHASGHAAIYDPAVYFGHREMDIGMTKLFGGFDHRFYAAYNEIYPLEKEWEKRLPLTQLYPLLVHASLFGGHYISEAREMIRQFA